MENNRKRNLLENGILVFNLLGALIGCSTYFLNKKLIETNPNMAVNSTYVLLTTIFAIITIITIIYIFMWNKIAMYGFAIISAINYIISFILKKVNIQSSLISTVVFIISLYVVYSLLKKVENK